MKTKADLFREYARILDFCERNTISPLDCIKFFTSGKKWVNIKTAEFGNSPDRYKFALGVVEGKPVFEGDTLYTENGQPCIIIQFSQFCQKLSWNTHANLKNQIDYELKLGKRLMIKCVYNGWRDITEAYNTGVISISNYKIEDFKLVKDDYYELKQAQNEGKVLEFNGRLLWLDPLSKSDNS